MPDLPWTIGTATGVGSHPGDDPAEALRVVLGGLPDLPYLPELPERGPGADMIGRAAGLLVELAVGLQPSGWRFADRPGRDTSRARSMLARDLDTLEERAGEYEGPFKIQIAGPWTLAASIELRHGDRALRDPGAVRELIASLAEGLAAHVADVRRRLPRATILLQLDEPGLPGVLAGTVPTASGFSRLRAVEAPIAEDGLRRVIEAADAFPIVHSCAPRTPYGLLRSAGAKAISVDAALLRGQDEDAIGEAVEAGTGFLLGVVPGTDTRLPAPKESLTRAQELWRRLGFSPKVLAEGVVVTPACGLAGASPAYVRAALRHCREAAQVLAETAED
ncbi:methionine synthase [Actinoallomurus purpureus]|uniref:methionine synthase n=1 Tax=Actinoallomurus purpureus TaxID=478114 RepID=UPI002093382D|nr:methionine synthase [Actinoallomurus purpureus]MCO6007491.1 methionine synthase [Actinoallomurus purpureus]